ncbi:DUF1918 domain-containing protein [Streptomyces sp. NPDC045251]|uniref:DUF1918 domain-containing protein n=1 Tax=unclassified Streptomyces TaxID=2593676 RepID=UPI0033E9C433
MPGSTPEPRTSAACSGSCVPPYAVRFDDGHGAEALMFPGPDGEVRSAAPQEP